MPKIKHDCYRGIGGVVAIRSIVSYPISVYSDLVQKPFLFSVIFTATRTIVLAIAIGFAFCLVASLTTVLASTSSCS